MSATKYIKNPVGAAWIVTNRTQGTPLSGAGRLAGRILPYRPSETSKEMFEDQFSSGHWNRLKETEQLGRYSLITGYCQHYSVDSILDVGCGQGVLQQHLNRVPYREYVGIDVSQEAIRMASETQTDERNSFVAADIQNYETEQRFDGIVFNEAAYYFDDPVGLVRRFVPSLADNGLFIISMFNSVRNDRIWSFFDEAFDTVDESAASHRASGKGWRIRVLRPSPLDLT